MDAKTRNRVLTVLFVGVLMGALDIAIVGPALPAIRDAFGVDDRAAAWIFTIYVFFSLVGAPIIAKFSDRYGRRAVYITNIGLFALGSLIVAIAPNFGVLLAGRAVQGLGAGGIFPVAGAVIGDTFPPEKQGGALGLIGAVFGIAFLIGPIVGGLLLLLGWPWLFLVNLPIALGIILLGMRLLPPTRATQRTPLDVLGMVLLSVMLGGFTIGISQLDTTNVLFSLLSLDVGPFLLLAVLTLPIFAWAERRAVDPLVRPSLLGTRQLILADALAIGAGVGEAAIVFLPALLVAAFAITESTASFLLMPIVLATAVGSPLAGRLLDKMGSRFVVLAGALVLTVGMFALSLLGDVFWIFVVSSILIGLGLSSLIGAPVRYIMLNEAPSEDRAAAQSVITVFMGIGQLLSSALVGAVAASAGGGTVGYKLAFFVVAIVSLLLIFLGLGLKGQEQERRTAAQIAANARRATTP